MIYLPHLSIGLSNVGANTYLMVVVIIKKAVDIMAKKWGIALCG